MTMNRRTLLKTASAAALATLVPAGLAETPFPPHFLWGASTAAHQVEGNDVNSDIWAIEEAPHTMFHEPSGDACDHYNRYPEDIALLAGLGFNAYRFSLNWARIEPVEGQFSRVELDHYRRMLEVCHRHNVTPLVTFVHVASPRWFAFDGGWENAASVDRFARFSERATRHMGDLMDSAATFNEPNLLDLLRWIELPGGKSITEMMTASQADLRRQLGAPQFSSFLSGDADRMQANMLRAHTKGREAIKSVKPELPVGLTLAVEDDQPAGEHSRVAEKRAQAYGPWLELSRHDEYIGVQTYTRQHVGAARTNLPPEKGAELTESGYEFYPEALEHTIRYVHGQTPVPIYVTENGVSTEDDTRRVEYLRRAVQGVQRCLADKIDVRGYLCWSLLDNFEWVSGYGQRFGLVAVDRTTQKRTPKPSAAFLGQLARKNMA